MTQASSAGSSGSRRWIRPGDHLKVSRGGYCHHGVCVADGWVIHFSGLDQGKSRASIRTASLDEFAQGAQPRIVEYGSRNSTEVTIRRAWSQLNQGGYHLALRNCEHFARWCCTGSERSLQVEKAAGFGGSAAVGLAGPQIALSAAVLAGGVGVANAPGLMAGLAAVGGPLGATGGAAAMVALPAAATASVANRTLFRDDPHALPEEREALANGRQGVRWGVALAAAWALLLLANSGRPGLSASGISSGLKDIGGTMGRGVAKLGVGGVLVALTAGGIAYAVTKANQRRRHALVAQPL